MAGAALFVVVIGSVQRLEEGDQLVDLSFGQAQLRHPAPALGVHAKAFGRREGGLRRLPGSERGSEREKDESESVVHNWCSLLATERDGH